LPVFLKEPQDTFVLKTTPAQLTCRVAHALSVHFRCNAEVVEPASSEVHVEPETGVRYTEARVEISRDQVEEYFAEYGCACVAISGKGSSISRHAAITYACEFNYLIFELGQLKKKFPVDVGFVFTQTDATPYPTRQPRRKWLLFGWSQT
jgi:hypothetical protein